MKEIRNSTPKKSPKLPKKIKKWTTEQDIFLKELVTKKKLLNWTTMCRRINKKFPEQKVTSKDCITRWQILSSQLTLNEELIILLTLHKGELEIAEELLKSKVDVKEHVLDMVSKTISMVNEIKTSQQLSTLVKLQFLVCVDLALNSQEDIFAPIRWSKVDWLEIVQLITKKKAKMSKESFHEFVEDILSSIQDKVDLILESGKDRVMEIMHKRRENPPQLNLNMRINSRANTHPFIGMNLLHYTNYPQNPPLIN